MRFECPNCKKSGQVDDSKVPDSGVYATCPQCSTKFLIKREIHKDFEFEPTEQPISNITKVTTDSEVFQRSQSTENIKAIWNPNAASKWSLFFSPAFGSYLQMLNWETLGKHDKANYAKKWFYASLSILAIYILIGLSATDSNTSDGLVTLIGLFYFVVWYLAFARAQEKYVKEKYGTIYQRKPFGKPLIIGVGAIIGYAAITLVIGLVNTNSATKSPAASVSLPATDTQYIVDQYAIESQRRYEEDMMRIAQEEKNNQRLYEEEARRNDQIFKEDMKRIEQKYQEDVKQLDKTFSYPK